MATLTTHSWLLLASSAVFATNFLDCDIGNPVQSVKITYCDDSVPLCTLFTGQEYQLNLTFMPDHQLWATDTFLYVTLFPITGGLPVSLKKELDGSCGIIAASVPIDPGVSTDFRCSITISGNDLGNYMSQLILNDDQGNVFCTQVEVVVI